MPNLFSIVNTKPNLFSSLWHLRKYGIKRGGVLSTFSLSNINDGQLLSKVLAYNFVPLLCNLIMDLASLCDAI